MAKLSSSCYFFISLVIIVLGIGILVWDFPEPDPQIQAPPIENYGIGMLVIGVISAIAFYIDIRKDKKKKSENF